MRRTLLGFIRKELTQTLRDRRMRVLLFLMPLIQLTVFGVAISNEVKNIRLAAQFEPKDSVARGIYERSIASGWFVPAVSHEIDPFKMIQAGDADAVLVAPAGGLTDAIVRQDAKLQLLVDATNVIQAQAIESYLQRVMQTTIRDELHIEPPKSPIVIEARVLFNPDLRTAVFMVPGTLCMLMLLTTMVMTNMAIVREKEMGTFEMLISAPVTSLEVILGKTIPYVVLGISNFPLILSVAVFVFQVPLRGSIFILFGAALVFICTAVALGTLISTFCQNQQQASLAGFLFTFPMMMFSGLMFPVENMPSSIRWIAQLDPLTHFMGVMRSLMLKGGDWRYTGYHVGILLLMALGLTIASFRRFKTTLQ